MKAIDCTKAIEDVLAKHLDTFRLFHNSITSLDIITIDDVIAAISNIDPLPDLILPAYLKRATKRNVYPVAIMNTVRLLNGTFKWNMSRNSTSIDIIFNHISLNVGAFKNHKPCNPLHEHRISHLFGPGIS
jgi:hypothetical protein